MSFDPIGQLSPKEKLKVAELEKKFTRDETLAKLKSDLQVAVEIELATLPVYLYTYYSINRQPGTQDEALNLFANKAGGVIMSVAVEEMLHMSLASNILFALGEKPKIYGRSPNFHSVAGGGTNLPYHNPVGPDGKPIAIPLAGLSYDTLWGFLEIEYPKAPADKLVDRDWQTIGDFYSYIRCLIATSHVKDSDFVAGAEDQQLPDAYYGQNCIDTVYPSGTFDANAVPMADGSAASVAEYPNSGDSHAGYAGSPDNDKELNTVHDKASAFQAISTICDQGEGYTDPSTQQEESTDDPSKTELSHYYKFLTLQSMLTPYTANAEVLPKHPAAPAAADTQWTPADLTKICNNYPKNPTTAAYPEQVQELSNLCNAVYQYMLLMTEASYTVSGATQVELFNVGMHKAMIWILDKLIQGMQGFMVEVNAGLPDMPLQVSHALAPTFENIDLTSGGKNAKQQVLSYIEAIKTKAAQETKQQQAQPNSYTNQLKMITNGGYENLIKQLPDISMLGQGETVVPVEVKHACMGLNACAGQGRLVKTKNNPDPQPNDCAGQGMCYTSNNHSCHTLNDCKHQGGCGLYGTTAEQSIPGGNECKGHGSCATPINAERFATAVGVEGQSVWQLARAAFEKRMQEENKTFGDPPAEAYQTVKGQKTAVGPSHEWIADNGCMTACGASGMSGGGSCG